MRSDLSPGLPPKRFEVDGLPIGHTIQTDPSVKPRVARPFPCSGDEADDIKEMLLLKVGSIVPSASLLVQKKPDPVTGERTLRMCFSYNVKLANRTWIGIADAQYRCFAPMNLCMLPVSPNWIVFWVTIRY
jgi:hypothetical protein